MTTEHVDALLTTLEEFYPGKFSEFSAATFALWKAELGDLPLRCALAAIRRWATQHHHQYAPTLRSLVTLAEEVAYEERRERARRRLAMEDSNGMAGVLHQAEEAYVSAARDDLTALYGRLMGALAQRSLSQKMSKAGLAAQCQAWAQLYPQLAGPLTQAARQFGTEGGVPF